MRELRKKESGIRFTRVVVLLSHHGRCSKCGLLDGEGPMLFGSSGRFGGGQDMGSLHEGCRKSGPSVMSFNGGDFSEEWSRGWGFGGQRSGCGECLDVKLATTTNQQRRAFRQSERSQRIPANIHDLPLADA